MVLICISWLAYSVEHLFMYLAVFHISFFVNGLNPLNTLYWVVSLFVIYL